MTPKLLDGRRGYLNAANLVLLLTLVMVATHLLQVFQYFLPSGQFKTLHLGLALLVIFASAAGHAGHLASRLAYVACFALSAYAAGYILMEYQGLISDRVFGPEPKDVVVGSLLVGICLIAAWQQWGLTIPLIGVLGLLYGYYGNSLPTGLLHHSGMGLERLVSYASIPNFQGVLGSLTELSAGTIFIFMVFAGLLKSTGGIDFIMGFATKLAGNSRGGQAKIAVLASAFMGMISGSTVANIASTGTMTIPTMKRTGFKAPFAGAVEAVSSTGGQMTPPVMGLTAFLMVGVTGLGYDQVILAAAIPAGLYYFYLILAVHLQAVRDGVGLQAGNTATQAQPLPAKVLMARYGHLLIAIGVLVFLLISRMPPSYAAAYGCLAIIVLELFSSAARQYRQPLQGLVAAGKRLIDGLREGGFSGATIAVIVAVIGIFVEVLTATGFAQKLSYLMLGIADGSLGVLLLIAALACLIFGLGLPTSAAYILVALLTAPALIDMGLSMMAAHMFVLYFAIFSALTPPVAVASLIAARIAEAPYFATAMQAVKIGLPGFFLPFLFVARPELLLLEGTLLDQISVVAISLLALAALNVAMVGQGFVRTTWPVRLILLFAATLTLMPGVLGTLVGCSAIVVIFAMQRGLKNRHVLAS
ncbi:TRAP transporter fused permease subunit [Halomonas sp. MCCC 1A17488]|uniref:TRAP transporter fused permease subunit n=1 Tax=Billgrantia sulfidoxydans TaxID=2733484 RepID=A0ABX7W6C0_9GAMM|nr:MULTISPECIES: TRAP transporter fused permease subunit [Halomonas]MCE8014989.1 TRAP transporter fused permease subunit [Halomonas sp. MCCC 1A17488]MCG3238322.1 TRAP transporter fused permease subunit [Halomonas sp. MCCC 1A17488]QPP47927.1 TRAP transporter fused permease subunit [Halomonas sp. SS10-MC5]QTP55232.1 TRAP transporter fused permease subunit [Halomonas sulfidoxydans]